MKPRIRDELIYLSVGIAVAGAVIADFLYTDIHGSGMWMPSRFAFRLVTTTLLLVWFVVREMRREKGTTGQIIGSVLFALLAQLGIMTGFRHAVDELPGITYSVLAVLELFLVWQASIKAARYLIHS